MGYSALKRSDHNTPDAVVRAWFDYSEDYRYALSWQFVTENLLSRSWLVAILLNPSTADAFKHDPTSQRLYKRAIALGYRGVTLLNLFAYRSTDPYQLRLIGDPIGIDNDAVLRESMYVQRWMPKRVETIDVLCGWGEHGLLYKRQDTVKDMLAASGRSVYVLGINKNGAPKHPLYISASKEPQLWELSKRT